jgi:5-formyltetrahydrofolate cyclo-ligase
MTTKPACRRLLRKRRNELSVSYRQRAAAAAAQQISALPGWETARRVAVYWPNDCELDPAGIVSDCRQRDRELYLPLLTADKQLLFGRWRPDQALLPNSLGIPEPDDDDPLSATGLDVVFLPLVGWHRDGTRLGMGGGYYDRTLAVASRPLCVGLGYDCQEMPTRNRDAWDVAMDFVLTETRLHRCTGAASGMKTS